jgi:hypothetical protein
MVNIGDWVRLREVPAWVAELDLPDVQAIYRFAIGKVFQIQGIDDAGRLTLELWPPENPLGNQVDVLHVDPDCVDVVPGKQSHA